MKSPDARPQNAQPPSAQPRSAQPPSGQPPSAQPPSPVLARGMWAIALHVCTTAGKCTEGVLAPSARDPGIPFYVSKVECEREAQETIHGFLAGMLIKYVKCVQL